jgi:tRNA(Ile)-lysidine synthetase-like protein
MEKRTLSFMQNNNLITNNFIVCAVSGGVDSVCLLHILYNLGFKVILAHVNHNKREESKYEAIAMNELANQLNIPYEYYSYHYDNDDNFHNDAHIARYSFFRDVCNKYKTNVIATAHHLDDQIETILIKMINGSNLYGYGGISSMYEEAGIKIIRPLLHTNKDELYDYAKSNNIIYFEDKSNNEDEFLRNKIRHHVIPNLKDYSNDFYNKISQYSNQIKEAFNFIRSISIKYLNDNNDTIILDSFNNLDVAVKKDIISLMLEKYKISKNTRIIHQILDILNDSIGTSEISLDGNYRFVRNYNIARIKEKTYDNYNCVKLQNDEIVYNNKFRIYFSKIKPNNNAKWIKLCYNSLELPFYIRPWKNGDEIKLQFGTKKLSRLFIDKKVPKDIRGEIPVITDKNNNILWVYGIAKSETIRNGRENGEIYLVCEEII